MICRGLSQRHFFISSAVKPSPSGPCVTPVNSWTGIGRLRVRENRLNTESRNARVNPPHLGDVHELPTFAVADEERIEVVRRRGFSRRSQTRALC